MISLNENIDELNIRTISDVVFTAAVCPPSNRVKQPLSGGLNSLAGGEKKRGSGEYYETFGVCLTLYIEA